MLAFVVTLRGGRRYTVQADELQLADDGIFKLLACLPGCTYPDGLVRAVAVFDRSDVVSVVSREHLLAEDAGEAVPFSVTRHDPIPF